MLVSAIFSLFLFLLLLPPFQKKPTINQQHPSPPSKKKSKPQTKPFPPKHHNLWNGVGIICWVWAFFATPDLLYWLETRCEQPASSCAGCVLTRDFTGQRKQSGYLLEKVITSTFYWKVAWWWINCEQCCTSVQQLLLCTSCPQHSAGNTSGQLPGCQGTLLLHGWITVPALYRYIFLGLLLLNGCRFHPIHPQCSCTAVHLFYSNSIFPLSQLSAGHSSWCLLLKNRLTLRQSHLSV